MGINFPIKIYPGKEEKVVGYKNENELKEPRIDHLGLWFCRYTKI